MNSLHFSKIFRRKFFFDFNRFNHYHTNNKQYLHKSILPTDFFQSSIPKLSIPKLKTTCEKYLESLSSIIYSRDQFENTIKIVKNFENGIGKELHEKLIEIDKINLNSSYSSQPILENLLKKRETLVLNQNSFIVWKDDPKPEFNLRTVRITNFIISALRFKKSFEENCLEPQIYHLDPKKSNTTSYYKLMKFLPKPLCYYTSLYFYNAVPLDISQLNNLFSTNRVPNLNLDEIVKFENSKHILVIRKGQIFTLDVLDENNEFKSPSHIFTCIKNICERKIDPNQNSVSIFSAENRTRWAIIREKIMKINEKNKENFRKIDSALFVICLDDVEFDQDLVKHAHNFLHGNPIRDINQKPYLNRFFDKSFSIIFTKDGHASINFESSGCDSQGIVRFFNEIYKDSLNHFISPSAKQDKSCNFYEEVEHLEFTFDNDIKNDAEISLNTWNELTSDVEINYTKFSEINQYLLRKNNLNPNSIFHLVIQLAYHRLYNKTVPIYENFPITNYKCGRTEIIRPCTNQAKMFCEGLLTKSKSLSKSELKNILYEFSQKHSSLYKEALLGQGFDKHLFCLKNIFLKENGENAILPELYLDESYLTSNQFELITSTINNDLVLSGGFGPKSKNSFSLSYAFINNQMNVLCSNYKSQKNGKQMIEAIEQSFKDVKSIIVD